MSITASEATPERPSIESPYLTPAEAAVYLRFPSTHWFRINAKKYGIPCIRRGRRVFYTTRLLDEFMATLEAASRPQASRRTRGKGRKVA